MTKKHCIRLAGLASVVALVASLAGQILWGDTVIWGSWCGRRSRSAPSSCSRRSRCSPRCSPSALSSGET